jgi:capsular polysaccharide biosynthesis protein
MGEASGTSDAAPVISLKVLKTVVLNRRRVWLSLAALGLIMGLGFHSVAAKKYVAVTKLVLVYPAGVDPSVQQANDLALLGTREVAQQALSNLDIRSTPESIMGSYRGIAPTGSAILSIRASSSSPAKAESLASAVTQAYLSIRGGLFQSPANAEIQGLQTYAETIQSTVDQLNSSIASLSSAAPSGATANQLNGLITQRTTDESQIAQLESQIQQDQLATDSVVHGSKVIDPPALMQSSGKKALVMDAMSGLILGLGLGIGYLLLDFLLSDRLRSRAEVAKVVGAPVELSLSQTRRTGITSRFRRGQTKQALDMIERRLLSAFESSPDSALAIVELESTRPSSLAVVALAKSLSERNRRVVLVDLGSGRPLARLLGVKATTEGPIRVEGDKQNLTLIVAPEDPAELAEKLAIPEDADALLVLATIDPAFGAEHLSTLASNAVIVLNVKEAKASRTTATAQLLKQAEIETRAAIMIGADSHDDSVSEYSASRFRRSTRRSLTVLPVRRR